MMEERKPRIVKNRDIPLLARVLGIMQDVCSLEKRIAWQHERMYGTTARITGMPGGRGVPNGFDATYAAISALNDEHKRLIREYVREMKVAEKIINGIPSMSMRTFVVMLYVNDMPASVVRRELNMTEYGFTRAREAVESAKNMASVVWRERYIVKDGED